jgi:hypothetical protein
MVDWKNVKIGDIIVFKGEYNNYFSSDKDRDQIVCYIDKNYCHTKFVDNGKVNSFAIQNPYGDNCHISSCAREYGNGLPIYWS